MLPPAGIELVARMSRRILRLRLVAAFAVGVLAVGCGAFVADPGYRATQLPDDVTKLFEVQQVVGESGRRHGVDLRAGRPFARDLQ